MSRINLVIGDTDDAYLDGLVNFIIRNYPHRFQVNSFSKQERIEKYLSEIVGGVDILLVGTELYSCSFEKYGAKCLAVLSGGNGTGIAKGVPEVSKYQQGHKLVANILDLYSGKSDTKTIGAGGGKDCRVVSVFSPQGGSGKTCVSISSCIQCTKKGMQVFYLNLEDFNSTAAFLSCSSHPSFSDIIFYLKEKNKNLPLKIEASKAIDPIWGIHFFSPPERDGELNEMSYEDIRELIEKIKSLGRYDFIFLDMSSRADTRNLELLRFSDEIVLTLHDGIGKEIKLERFFSDFSLLMQKDLNNFESKFKLVLNRCRGEITEGIPAESHISGIDTIRVPEIEKFNPSMISQIVTMDNRYMEAIDMLVHKWVSGPAASVCSGGEV